MNRVLLIIGGLLVGLLAALFVVPVFVDWTRYRGVFEEEATRLLGREVRVGGRVNLRLLPTPYIRFEKVRVADVQATVGEPLFRADDFTVWLSVGALLKGEIQASEIELGKPVVTLVLDEDGSGNWASLSARQGQDRPVFAPEAVALDTVRITNGSLTVKSQAGEERSRFEHINGELSAAALEGPFKMTAAFAQGGVPREFRLATSKADSDGSIRFKGAVRAPQTGATYALDGVASNVFQKLAVQGELTAKLPLAEIAIQAAGPSPADAKKGAEAVYDLKAQLTADTGGAVIKDIALSFEQDGRPQLATGEGRVTWRDRPSASLDLSSRWLDLDRIGGRSEGTTMPELLQRFLASFERGIPTTRQTTVRIGLDQATLGGETVSGLSLALERDGGPLGLKAQATLPGGTRFEFAGTAGAEAADAWLTGTGSLRGASFAKFSQWSGRGTPVAAWKQDGPFVLAGRITVGRQRVSARELQVRVAGINVAGEAGYGWVGGSRQVQLVLDGSELDASPLLDSPAGVMGLLTAIAGKSGGDGTADKAEVTARLRLGRLSAGSTILRDVDADVTLAGGRLAIPGVRFGAEDGHSIELSGDVAGFLRQDARGSIAYLATAKGRSDLDELLAALGLRDIAQALGAHAESLVPLRVAGRLRFGEAQTGAAEASFDGRVGATRATGTVRTGKRGATWRDSPLDIAATLESDSVGALLAVVSPGRQPKSSDRNGAARLTLRGIGVPRTGVVSLVSLDGDALSAEYRGRISVDDAASLGFDGNARFSASDLTRALAQLGIADRPTTQKVAMAGTAKVTGGVEQAKLDAVDIDIGGARISGRLDADMRGARPRISGEIACDRMSVPELLAAFASAPRAGLGGGALSPAPRQSAWSEDAIDLSLANALDVTVRLDARSLVPLPGMLLGKSQVDFESRDGRLQLRLTDAGALGGKLTGVLSLEKAPAGIRGLLETRLGGARLETFAPAGTRPAATGTASLALSAEGTGLSARGLVAAMRGKGELKLGKVQVERLAPKTVVGASMTWLGQKGEISKGDLARLLQETLAGGAVTIGDRTLAIEISDGVARLAPVAVDTPEGRLTGQTVVDAEAMRIDSEWRVDAALTRPAVKLPTVTVVYAGPVAAVGQLEPRIDAEGLERELTVRRMERDLDELERLRRTDEERARLEAERTRQIEVERLRQQFAPGAAPQRDSGAPPAPTIAVPLPVAPQAPAARSLPGAEAPPPHVHSAQTTTPAGPPAEPGAEAAPPAEAAPVAAPPPAVAPAPRDRPPRPQTQPRPRQDVFREIGRSNP